MVKCAILIGINYNGTSSELSGCINDINNTEKVLSEQYGYNEFVIMTDDSEMKPTGKNIIKELYDMALRTHTEEIEELWISYSGHGSYVTDRNGDEDDSRDEVLVPIDCNTNGYISDDLLHKILKKINPRTKCICIFDCCHSGTILDLKYRYESGVKNVTENKNSKLNSNITMISGCKDVQTSADAYNILNARKYQGAMTASLLTTLKDHEYKISCYKLLKYMREFLKERNFKQIPQISCSKKLDEKVMFC